MRWNTIPFLFLTPSLILGILINEALPHGEKLYFLIVLLLGVFSGFYLGLKVIYKSHFKLVILPLLFISFVLVGVLSSGLHWYFNSPNISEDSVSKINTFTARIDSKPVETDKTYRYEVTIDKIKVGDSWQNLAGKAILYALDKTKFEYGQMVIIEGNPEILKRQTNPHAFDYTLFLQRKGIFLAAYFNNQNYHLLEENHSRSLLYLPMRIGDVFEDILSRYIESDRALSMIKAMVIGRRNDITPEMDYAYQATGTSHILAVSGLHVGIIYLVISYIFNFSKRKGWRWLYYSIIVFSIWGFALITGLSPSVRRAALMFSFIIIAEMIHRKSNIYNTILASAFCILLFSPNLIYSVSFQFSYMAVLGIVFLYNKIYNLIYIKSRFIDFFWQITALSISVQLATFAIGIHYFHHFPILFPITNLFAIPTAMIVVVGSLLIFSFSFLPFMAQIIGFVLEKWVNIYNDIMFNLSKFSATSIEGIYLKSIYVYLIILVLFLLIRFIETRKVQIFKLFTFGLILITIVVFVDHYRCAFQRKLFVYDLNDQICADIFIGNRCYTSVQLDPFNPDVKYHLIPNRRFHLISETRSMDHFHGSRSIEGNQLIMLNNKTFLFLNNPPSLNISSELVEIDYLILGTTSWKYLDKITAGFNAKHLILHGNWRKFQLDFLKKNIWSKSRFHVIEHEGAFSFSI